MGSIEGRVSADISPGFGRGGAPLLGGRIYLKPPACPHELIHQNSHGYGSQYRGTEGGGALSLTPLG